MSVQGPSADRSEPAVPVVAATLMLLRDGAAGLEILMMVRHDKSGFAGGALVFPGGKIEPGDRVIAARDGRAPAPEEFSLVLRIAAIRETYEECGILLARQTGAPTILSPAELAKNRLPGDSEEDFAGMLASRELELALDALLPFANWITPVISPKRFDTHFFVAKISSDQVARHDGREAVEVLWTTPGAAIAAAEAGDRILLPPTYLNLRKLIGCANADEALEVARRTEILPITPELISTASGTFLRIPESAGYGLTRVPAGQFGVRAR